MLLFEELDAIPARPADGPVHVAVGTFDGVHLGHRTLIRTLAREARPRGGKVMVFTFQNHPRSVVAPHSAPPLLSPWAMKKRLLSTLPVDLLVGIAFTPDFAATPAEAFVREVLLERLHATRIVSGRNFRFGSGGAGGPDLLHTLSGELGYEYERIEPMEVDGERISSTRIRGALEHGHVEQAATMLGRPHQLTAAVVSGDGLGRRIGFPTANLRIPDDVLLPANGVYAVAAFVGDGTESIPGMMNIGWRPTVGGTEHRTEVHLIDWEGDLTGTDVTVAFLCRTRDEKRFSGPDELARQLARDRDQCRKIVGAAAIQPA